LNPDPHPAFQVNPIRFQGFDDQKLKKKIQLKLFKSLFDQKLQFAYVQATGEAFSRQKKKIQHLIRIRKTAAHPTWRPTRLAK
jgi:hypothetical protein